MAKTYNPKNVKVVVDGTILTGFADGTFVQCTKNTETNTMHVGAQGEVDFVQSADDTGQITVTLKHTSPSNTYLMKKARAKDPFAVSVVDRNDGKMTAGGTQCKIQKQPDTERGDDISSMEWVFLVADYDLGMK